MPEPETEIRDANVTAGEEASRKKRWLRRNGYEGDLDVQRQPWRQWYDADGRPLPGLLPADEYHVARNMDKGWTLVPPTNTPPPPKGLSPIQQEIANAQAKREAKEVGDVQYIEDYEKSHPPRESREPHPSTRRVVSNDSYDG